MRARRRGRASGAPWSSRSAARHGALTRSSRQSLGFQRLPTRSALSCGRGFYPAVRSLLRRSLPGKATQSRPRNSLRNPRLARDRSPPPPPQPCRRCARRVTRDSRRRRAAATRTKCFVALVQASRALIQQLRGRSASTVRTAFARVAAARPRATSFEAHPSARRSRALRGSTATTFFGEPIDSGSPMPAGWTVAPLGECGMVAPKELLCP
jgi:hypothetical protein